MKSLLIDRFVAARNLVGFGPEICSEVPPLLRASATDELGCCVWKITPIEEAPWIDAMPSSSVGSLPSDLLDLYSGYAFLKFDLGPLSFFANTGIDAKDDFSMTIGRDVHLTNLLLKTGYLHFAHMPSDADYDPICFDTNKPYRRGDYAIVQIDHEDALIKSRIRIVKVIAKSFQGFLSDFIERSGASGPSFR